MFRNDDCTYTALHGHYLHYQKTPGQWDDVDLNFRSDGVDFVMDRHDIEVRITGATVRATERASGKGIRWILPMPPVVAGRSARYSAGGLQWEYTTSKPGLKLAATVPASLGQRTWEFPYRLVGGAAPLSVDEDGNIQSDVFSVPRPYAVGADEEIYPVGAWRLLPGSRVAFDFDDSALPAEAFPYELDPTTNFSVASGLDDGHVYRSSVAYPPPDVGTRDTAQATTSTISAIRSCQNSDSTAASWTEAGTSSAALCTGYEIRNALTRWNTSALPDSAVVTGATLRASVSQVSNNDSRSLTADWYSAWPIDNADYSETAQSSALSRSLSTISTGNNDFALSNPGFYVSKTGYTGVRLHISGGQPDGGNRVDIRSYESTWPEPQLLVTYSTPPTISTASDSPDPVTAGNPITFSTWWADADPGDSVRAVICKTNQIISGGSCPGGYWGWGNLSATSPSTASFTPTALDHGSQTYYAFTCDAAGACSSSLSGTFTVLNRPPTITTVSDSPDPVVAGNPVTFTASWSDPGDTARAVICKTDQVTSGTCPGGAWTIGAPSYSPSTASFTPWDIAVGTQTFYAFVCDAAATCSSSLSGTFEVTPSQLIIDDLFAVVAERVPGFGGMYVDEGTGELFVFLTDPSQPTASSAQAALVEVLGSTYLNNFTPVALQGQYNFVQLNDWINRITADVLAIPGAVSTDIADSRNRIVVGMESVEAQGPAVAAVISSAGVPAEAVIFEKEQAPEFYGLRNRHRPLVGGLQIVTAIGQDSDLEALWRCSLGFIAVRNGVYGFVTASHCSSVQWRDERTMYFQPAFDPSSPAMDLVGDETVDPQGFTHADEPKCPVGSICRYSDASFVSETPGAGVDVGRIARSDLDSTNWDHATTFAIVDKHKPTEGMHVIKVGRKTGRTNGVVTDPCKHTGVRGNDRIYLICQSVATVHSRNGDSGSPVFSKVDNNSLNVKLVGLLWGGTADSTYFSGINQVTKSTDLGPLRTCVGLVC